LLEALFKRYEDYYFIIYDKKGKASIVKGLYFITDNGYPRWAVLIRPDNNAQDSADVFFMKWIESVRKDIECVFGILKSRFRFLRNAISYHSPKTITNAFKVAATLHNILLKYDNLVHEFGTDIEETFDLLDPNDLSDINCAHQFKDGNFKGSARRTFTDD
jgi:hypothetical protein